MMDVQKLMGARLRRAVVETLENRCLLSANPFDSSPAALSVRAEAFVPAISRPSVTTVSPAPNSTGVPRDSAVTVDLFLPNSSLDFNTITTGTVFLQRTSDQSVVPAVVSTTGGDDAIILQPSVLLDPNTSYTFTVTSSVRDISGQQVNPFTMTFTTGTAGGATDPSIAFQQLPQANSVNVPWTTVRVGPDHELWAGAEDGRIFRFPINADGSLGSPQVFTSLQTANGGPRLLTGFAFDPASIASNPILWVSNGFYGFSNAPDFSSKITRLSGSSLQTVQDVVVNLPRSVADHLTDQPVFGPDGALYFGQAAENSMGAPDPVWGMRPEHMLSAAILRLDVTKVTPGQPLNALTPDAGGSYNPDAPGAPLTIYASGVRNAFDLLWSSDNHLYAPVNGASAGGNVPAGPSSPAINQNPQVESDYLDDIVQGGYFGHPNPTLGHFVLDGGNPTAGTDPAEVQAYPVGTAPDPAWHAPVFDFGLHRSADGIIQYTGSAFGGALNGKILVAEYSAGADIVVLSRDASGHFTGERRITGLSGFNNPLSLAEDPATGDIYVAEL
ncbi:MAG TPA: Ig-like domain-containing protein, partial [Mycobacterium sp.]|uniref:Ig-like domain-containing protein n=1 Tax=Mycobacterium sp. TaxID=1785 RepID=UPI002D63AD23